MQKKRLLMGGAAIALAMALVGIGVYAAFTDTETAQVDIDTGQLDIVGAGNIEVDDIAPGDIVFHDISVSLPGANNDGNLVQSIELESSLVSEIVGGSVDSGDPDPGAPFTPGSLWNGADGLEATVAFCDGPWTLPADGDPLLGDTIADGIDDSAECDGGTGTIIAQPLADLDDLDLSLEAADFGQAGEPPTGTITDGSTLNLLIQLQLPASADNGYENANVVFDLVFDAVQRTGVNR